MLTLLYHLAIWSDRFEVVSLDAFVSHLTSYISPLANLTGRHVITLKSFFNPKAPFYDAYHVSDPACRTPLPSP
jgi:hypothetical protein